MNSKRCIVLVQEVVSTSSIGIDIKSNIDMLMEHIFWNILLEHLLELIAIIFFYLSVRPHKLVALIFPVDK